MFSPLKTISTSFVSLGLGDSATRIQVGVKTQAHK